MFGMGMTVLQKTPETDGALRAANIGETSPLRN